MNKFIKFHLATLLFILISSHLIGQTRIKTVELETQKSIRKLISKKDSLNFQDTVFDNNLRKLYVSTRTLFEKINGDPTFTESEDTLFVSSLEQSQKKLDQLIANWPAKDDLIQTVQFLRKDYDIKINASPLGLASKITRTIEVSVITRIDNNDLSGYDVKCNYMWDSDLKTAKIVFNNQTNNAIRNLSPGYYVFWIEKNGILIQKREKIEIGNLKQNKEKIIFNL